MSTRTKAGIAIVCGALLASLPATALAVFPGNNSEILFVSGRAAGDATAGIYLIDGPNDTSPQGPIDFITGQHRHPNWSPRADSIVFASRVADNGCPTSQTPNTDEDLFLRDPLGGTALFEPSADCVLEDHPTFSPDGRKIAYESEVTNGSGQKDILIANADGSGTPQNFTNSSGITEETPVWSPDGRFIYYASRTAAQSDIHKHRVSGGTPQPVPGIQTGTNEFQPEISPNGRRLCYTLGDFGSGTADVMVANVNGNGTPFELSPSDTNVADYDCGWSPNGERIAWTRGAFGTGELYFAVPEEHGPNTPYGNNSGTFDGNVDWSRIPGQCDGKLATIAGTRFDDDIVGTPRRDVIVSFEGKDKIKGKGGNDRICGGDGNDTLSGVQGKDRLFGGKGRDDLNGGPQKDRCDGGPGQDAAESCERKTKI